MAARILCQAAECLTFSPMNELRKQLQTYRVHQKCRQLKRSTWTMVLPELSGTMAYTTRNTVNRLARKYNELYKSCGTRTIKGGINLYIELQKRKLSRKVYSFVEVKLCVSEEKYDTRDKNLQTVLIIAGPGVTIQNVSNTLTVYVIFCPSETNTWRLKKISCNINEPKQYNNTWQKLQRCQTQRSDMQITAEIMQTYDLFKFAIAQSNGSTLLKVRP